VANLMPLAIAMVVCACVAQVHRFIAG
jgi:hypothetical protein